MMFIVLVVLASLGRLVERERCGETLRMIVDDQRQLVFGKVGKREANYFSSQRWRITANCPEMPKSLR